MKWRTHLAKGSRVVRQVPSDVVASDPTGKEELGREDRSAPDDKGSRLDEVLFAREKVEADSMGCTVVGV